MICSDLETGDLIQYISGEERLTGTVSEAHPAELLLGFIKVERYGEGGTKYVDIVSKTNILAPIWRPDHGNVW